MKDYYHILGVPDDAGPEEIKHSYRQLALKFHPDRNPGREKEAGDRFKEINEAYSVLSNEGKRREYDYIRRSPMASASAQAPGYGYGTDDIFRESFSNPQFYEDLNRFFAQSGLRFDREFVNSTLFGGRGFVFTFTVGPNGFRRQYAGAGSPAPTEAVVAKKKRGLTERFALWTLGFMIRHLFGLKAPQTAGQDLAAGIDISPDEARGGSEREIAFERDGKKKRVVVKIPPGIEDGTRIRLRGMGRAGNPPGDLYVKVGVK